MSKFSPQNANPVIPPVYHEASECPSNLPNISEIQAVKSTTLGPRIFLNADKDLLIDGKIHTLKGTAILYRGGCKDSQIFVQFAAGDQRGEWNLVRTKDDGYQVINKFDGQKQTSRVYKNESTTIEI